VLRFLTRIILSVYVCKRERDAERTYQDEIHRKGERERGTEGEHARVRARERKIEKERERERE